MASSKEYLDYILDCLSGLDEITARKMMGEYMIYFRSKLVGGIYDNRFLVKDLPSAQRLMPDAPRELPYEGGKADAPCGKCRGQFFYITAVRCPLQRASRTKAAEEKELRKAADFHGIMVQRISFKGR